jgi:hypothetical protein
MTMAAGARMWESKMFTEDQMAAWENKTPMQQTWQNLQEHFTEKIARAKTICASHRKTVAVQGCSLAAQELEAVEEEGKTTAMMFALLQKQHKAQLKAMATANKQAMDAMLERMNMPIAGQGKAADKPTATVPNSNTGQAPNTVNRKKKVCTNCRNLLFSTNRKLAMS